jgi:hypothetical protein
MNVDIGTEAARFPEKEYISGIFLAVYIHRAIPNIVESPFYLFQLKKIIL